MLSDPSAGEPLGDATLILSSAARLAPRATTHDWLHSLVVVEGQEPGHRRVLSAAQPLRLGRRAQLEWPLADPQVSGLHCTVRVLAEGDALEVVDEHSSNGTFVDGERVAGRALLARGALLQVGRQLLRHDHLPRREIETADELQRDLAKARHYVESLLPAPLVAGPLQARWVYQPSLQLGGDALGYQWLADGRFVFFLVDVSGHGAGAAMHSVSILNVLRQQAMPEVDIASPAQVLQRLNTMFPMEAHAGMYFSIWYGVFDPATRALRYASGGHHPALVRGTGGRVLQTLRTRNPVIGASEDAGFVEARAVLPAGARLHLFSDGLYEVIDRQGRAWGVAELQALLEADSDGLLDDPQQLLEAVRREARPGPLDDDASLLVVTFLS